MVGKRLVGWGVDSWTVGEWMGDNKTMVREGKLGR